VKTKFMLMTIVLGVLSTTGITGAQEERKSGPPHTEMSMNQNCPMKVPGTDLSVTDSENGIVLTITTKSGDVAELRRRIESMAKMHSMSSNAAMHGNSIPFSIRYEEVPGGARLTLTPTDPNQLNAFRTTIRKHAEQMKQGECSMMQGMMKGMMDGMKNRQPTASPEPQAKPEEQDHSAHHPSGEKK
jgi:hypothetical protein